ncbi:MAG: hypothetical protein IT374_12940 [Polyangiaceae bacterium]|nr:hypothetical protein [Polyangiaceae bacterium]
MKLLLSSCSLLALSLAAAPALSQEKKDAPTGDAPAPAAPAGPPAAPSAPPTPSPTEAAAEVARRTPHPSDVARSSDFVDSRLTWTFGDDDVTRATGEAIPLSPKPSVGDRSQYRLFADNLNSRFGGRENLTHLVLYKKMPGYIEGVETEAALVLRIDMAQLAARKQDVNAPFYDSGSYLRVLYKTGMTSDGKRPTGLDLTLFPLDTDRFRLGYLYAISWGGTAASINESIFPRLQGTAPGAKLQYTGSRWYGFVGFKTAMITQVKAKTSGTGESNTDVTNIQETNYGLLTGGGADLADMMRADVGAGYFEQGTFQDAALLGKRVYTMGASGRVVVHHGMPVPASVDFQLYRNDPTAPMVVFRPEQYTPGRTTWAVALEGSRLMQNLADFDRPGSTKLQPATAGGLTGTVKSGFLRVQASAIYRDVSFVVKNQPGFIPFTSLPKGAKTQPEEFLALAFDYYLPKLHLTPLASAGVQLPATFGSSFEAGSAEVEREQVVRAQGNVSNLPYNKKRVAIIQARVGLKWDLSQLMSTMAWVQLSQDNNATRIEQAPDGSTYLRVFQSPTSLGFGVMAQARY